MKTIAVLAMLVIFGGVVHGYGSEFDNIDMEAVVNDEKALQSILYCFIEWGPCGYVTQSLKAKLPEVMHEACAKCSPYQKRTMKLFLIGSHHRFPQDFEVFRRKYDPEGTLFHAFVAALD